MTAETHSPPAPRSHAAGFSLLEILVVIGILTVLIALSVVGFRVVGTASREKVTDNQLENCKSLLAEYELTSSAAGLFATPPVAAGHWSAPSTSTPVKTPSVLTCTAAAARPGSDDTLLQDTARVIARLKALPNNRQSLEKMPAERVKGQPFAALAVAADSTVSPSAYPAATLPAGSGVVLLDGTGFPIYFVPGGGLTGVNRAYKGSGDRTDATNYDSPGGTITAPDRRPFWASPGPDGDLTTGDDNLYSFGK